MWDAKDNFMQDEIERKQGQIEYQLVFWNFISFTMFDSIWGLHEVRVNPQKVRFN